MKPLRLNANYFEGDAALRLLSVVDGLVESKADADSPEFTILADSLDDIEPAAVVRLRTYLVLRIFVQAILESKIPFASHVEKFVESRKLSRTQKMQLYQELGPLVKKLLRPTPVQFFDLAWPTDHRPEDSTAR